MKKEKKRKGNWDFNIETTVGKIYTFLRTLSEIDFLPEIKCGYI